MSATSRSESEASKDEQIKQLKEQVQSLQKELQGFTHLIDDTLDKVRAEEEKEDKKSLWVYWSDIFDDLKTGNDENIIELIHAGKIHPINDKVKWGWPLFRWCCKYGRIKLVKLCMNMGFDPNGEEAQEGLIQARNGNHLAVVEYLILQRLSGGAANKIVDDCNAMWREDGVLEAFVAEMEAMPPADKDKFAAQLVGLVHALIEKRNPVNSFLLNLAMRLGTAATWTVVHKTVSAVLKNTKDAIGWHYLDSYLLNGSSLLFRKYQLGGAIAGVGDEEKDQEQEQEAPLRELKELNFSELACFMRDYIHKGNEKGGFDDGSHREKQILISDQSVNLIVNAIESEQMSGQQFAALFDVTDGLWSFFQSCGLDSDSKRALIDSLEDTDKIHHNMHAVPRIQEPQYGFDLMHDAAVAESEAHAHSDIKPVLENEGKHNSENWQFIRAYGAHTPQVEGRLRQDSLVGGVKPKYSKRAIVQGMSSGVDFNALKFYDLNVYLNELMLRCGMLDDPFQRQVKAVFAEQRELGAVFREGPLKRVERCRAKSETDYHGEAFPNSACLLDICRCTVSFASLDAMVAGIRWFEQYVEQHHDERGCCLKEIVRIKNGFADYDHAKPDYCDIKYNVRVAVDGVEVVAEIQLLLQSMAAFKAKSHKFYNVTRKKDEFESLKLVSSLKNNARKQLLTLCDTGSHKGISEFLIKARVKTLEDLCALDGMAAGLKQVYKHGHLKVLKILLPLFAADQEQLRGFLFMLLDDTGRTGFMIALGRGHTGCAKAVLAAVKDDNVKQELALTVAKNGSTSLIFAAEAASLDAVKCVLSVVPDYEPKLKLIQSKDSAGSTAFSAAFRRDIAIAQYILSEIKEEDRQAKIDVILADEWYLIYAVQDAKDATSAEAAVSYVLDTLLELSQDRKLVQDFIERCDYRKHTVVISAALTGYVEVLPKVLSFYDQAGDQERKMKLLDMEDEDGNTLLIQAASYFSLAKVESVLSVVPDYEQKLKLIQRKGSAGSTAFSAALRRDTAIAQCILSEIKEEDRQAKIDVILADNDCLIHAVSYFAKDASSAAAVVSYVLDTLLELSQDRNLVQDFIERCDSTKQAVVMHAAQKGYVEVLRKVLSFYDQAGDQERKIKLLGMEDSQHKTAKELAKDDDVKALVSVD